MNTNSLDELLRHEAQRKLNDILSQIYTDLRDRGFLSVGYVHEAWSKLRDLIIKYHCPDFAQRHVEEFIKKVTETHQQISDLIEEHGDDDA